MTCLDAIIVILACPTMPCIHLVIVKYDWLYLENNVGTKKVAK